MTVIPSSNFSTWVENYSIKNHYNKTVLVAQLCPTLCDPMDCILPGSSVHGISQARIHVCVWCMHAQSYLILRNPMDYNSPGSSVHGIFQTRIIECIDIPFSRVSSQPRDWTWVSCTAGRFWATREAQNITKLFHYNKTVMKAKILNITRGIHNTLSYFLI